MRLFIGFFTEERLYDNIRKIKSETKHFIEGKWIRPENCHITFQFLGEVAEEKLNDLIISLERLSQQISPLYINYKGLGIFGLDNDKPKQLIKSKNDLISKKMPVKNKIKKNDVLWMGITSEDSEKESLISIAGKIIKNNADFDIKTDAKPFFPHLTICRISSYKKDGLLKLLEKYKDTKFDSEVMKSFSLIKSVTNPAGAKYATIKEFNLIF